MTPDRRAELRRLEYASFRTTASHDNEVLKATIDEQEGIIEGQDSSIAELKERIKALESLLAETAGELKSLMAQIVDLPSNDPDDYFFDLFLRIDAILPKTEEVK